MGNVGMQDWHDASEGKTLVGFRVVLVKEYLDPHNQTVYEHSKSYRVDSLGHDLLCETIFTDLDHDVEDRVKRMAYQVESRHRRTRNQLENIRRFL